MVMINPERSRARKRRAGSGESVRSGGRRCARLTDAPGEADAAGEGISGVANGTRRPCDLQVDSYRFDGCQFHLADACGCAFCRNRRPAVLAWGPKGRTNGPAVRGSIAKLGKVALKPRR